MNELTLMNDIAEKEAKTCALLQQLNDRGLKITLFPTALIDLPKSCLLHPAL